MEWEGISKNPAVIEYDDAENLCALPVKIV
jgi:hypothetical protein